MMPKSWLSAVLKFALCGGLIWWLLSNIRFATAWDHIRSLDPLMLARPVLLMLMQVGLGIVRWSNVLWALGHPLAMARAAAIYYSGVVFSVALPGTVGGDAVRIWETWQQGHPLATAINSVVLDRVVMVFALLLLAAAAQVLLVGRVPVIPGMVQTKGVAS